ncbi:hypothetical protein GCM10010168_42570 [Actinoplanes ianthinogenes]|uniref:Hemolysin type calcium-binding protein n=1 Tax=Actinoplanes ianthinogenes TaxID=122358 RepID=A0ABM7LVR6_9ACTN|nr:calcium-binding protein [Actinoplanes ianthinogenes]BCJ43433.1 hypothetical protein Aiant_40900 [Actinoplanes ianthinogenes]GGR20152.1 hypothetical protein GCM10010168_42570 [Actinoplanes ianthinogenes]
MLRNHWPAGVGLTLLAIVASGAVATPAMALTGGDAYAGTSRVTFRADSGDRNQVVITRAGRYVVIDDRVTINPGKGCKRVKGDKTKVRCKTKKPARSLYIKVYDRNDSVVNNSDLRMEAYGGTGSDTLVGGPKADMFRSDDTCEPRGGNDRIYGRGGNDEIFADDGSDYISAGDGNDLVLGDSDCANHPIRPGNDVIHGGKGDDELVGGAGDDQIYGDDGSDWLAGQAGRDRLDGGAGDDALQGDENDRGAAADVLLGGPGRDRLDYFAYAKSITVDLDGSSGDDGLPGERDTVGADVEDIISGPGDDRLTGNETANHLEGYYGNDVIVGGGGDDELDGVDGSDKIYGGAGDDAIITAGASSLVDGGPDNDVCRVRPETTAVFSCEVREIW